MLDHFPSPCLAFLEPQLNVLCQCNANATVITCHYSLTIFRKTIDKAIFWISVPEFLGVYPSGAFNHTLCVCNVKHTMFEVYGRDPKLSGAVPPQSSKEGTGYECGRHRNLKTTKTPCGHKSFIMCPYLSGLRLIRLKLGLTRKLNKTLTLRPCHFIKLRSIWYSSLFICFCNIERNL